MSTMKTNQNIYYVYYGPSTTEYPSVGSVSPGESVTVLWRDGSWYYIQYDVTGTSNKKCGYVPTAYVSRTETLNEFEDLVDGNAGTRYVNTDATTYTGSSSSGFAVAGSVDRGEAVQYLGYKSNNYAFIEYNITGSSQKKRAFVYANYLSTAPVTTTNTLVEIARGQIGEGEDDNGATKYGRWYAEWFDDDSFINADWCAMFISWCANEAGILTTARYADAPYVFLTASVNEMKRLYSENGRLLSATSTTPQIGDIAICSNSGSTASLDHVAIVSDYNASTKKVTYIEGNSSNNDVGYKTATNNGGYIVYYGR